MRRKTVAGIMLALLLVLNGFTGGAVSSRAGTQETGKATSVGPGAKEKVEQFPANPNGAKREQPSDDPKGVTRDGPPGPGSKNATGQPQVDPGGVTRSGPARPGTKNSDDVTSSGAAELSGVASSPTITGSQLIACGVASDTVWNTTSASFTPIRSCTITVPGSGFLYMSGSASLGLTTNTTGAEYEARFNLNVDSIGGNPATDRWVNVYRDVGGDGTDQAMEIAWVTAVTTGTHTLHFLAARYSGTGTVQLYDPTFSVMYLPGPPANLGLCSASSDTVWTTTSTSFQTIRSCTFEASEPGYAFIVGNASAGLGSGGAYEGRVRIGVNSTTGSASTDRWFNVYTDPGDGTDLNVTTHLLTTVGPGANTINFLGTRYAGAGTVQLYDPTLSVIFIPNSAGALRSCGAAGNDIFQTSSSTYQAIRSCNLSVPQNSWAIMEASASAGLSANSTANEYEGRFRLGVDSGFQYTDRWVNVYADPAPGDGTDRVVADTVLAPLTAGAHTFSFLGARYAGPGNVFLYSPNLSVLMACPITFNDVQQADYFYMPVQYLYCRGIVSGYADNTFRPFNNTTRGQLSKIVVLAQGWPLLNPVTPTFSDVPGGHPFYQEVETAFNHGIISGYSDGTFRPGNNVTRAQLSKIVVLAKSWPLLNPPTPTFSDVPRDYPFYREIETAYARGIISGYSDGTFRPYNNATRGQIAKIVHGAAIQP